MLCTRFSHEQKFISTARLKLAKNQANAKPRPKAELSLFENYSICIHIIIQT